MNEIVKKIFKILFWVFWILVGLALVGFLLGLYVQITNPQNVDISDVQGIIPKIVLIILVVTVTTVVLGSLFAIVLILLGIYFLVTVLILFFKWLIRKKK